MKFNEPKTVLTSEGSPPKNVGATPKAPPKASPDPAKALTRENLKSTFGVPEKQK